jgi:hypothetical protein
MKPEYLDRNIVCSRSECTFNTDPATGKPVTNPDTSLIRGQNAQHVFSGKSTNVHIITKWMQHNVDGWDSTKYIVDEGFCRFVSEDLSTPERIEQHKIRYSDFGFDGYEVAIGFRKYADSFRETYPGCNLVSFSHGGLWRPDIIDQSCKTYVLNDIWNYLVAEDDNAGIRSFDQLPAIGAGPRWKKRGVFQSRPSRTRTNTRLGKSYPYFGR